MKKGFKLVTLFIFIMLIGMFDVSALGTNGTISKDDVENDTYIIGDFMFNHKRIDDDDYVGDNVYDGALLTEYLMLGAGSLSNANGNKDAMKVYYKNLRGDWINPINDEPIAASAVPNQFVILYVNNALSFELPAPVYDVDFNVSPAGEYEGDTAIYFADIIHESGEFYDVLDRTLEENFIISEINVYCEDENDDICGNYDHNQFRVAFPRDTRVRFTYTIQMPNGVVETPKSDVVTLRAQLPGVSLEVASNAYNGYESAALRSSHIPAATYAAYIPVVGEVDPTTVEETETEYIYKYGVDKVPYLIYSVKLHDITRLNADHIDNGNGKVTFEVYDAVTNKRITKKDLTDAKVKNASYDDVITIPVEVGTTRSVYAKLVYDVEEGLDIYSAASEPITLGDNFGIPQISGIKITDAKYFTQESVNYVKYTYDLLFNYEFDHRTIGRIYDEYAGYKGLTFPVDASPSSFASASGNTYTMPFNATELVNITPYVNKSDGTKISSTTSYTIN